MLYTVACAGWQPGSPLTPASSRSGLFRTRSEARAAAEGRPTLAVALRYDPTRGEVAPQGPSARAAAGPWTAPAIVDTEGRVTVLAAIPADLVRMIGPAEVRAHPGILRLFPRPRAAQKPPQKPHPARWIRPGRYPRSALRPPDGDRPRPLDVSRLRSSPQAREVSLSFPVVRHVTISPRS